MLYRPQLEIDLVSRTHFGDQFAMHQIATLVFGTALYLFALSGPPALAQQSMIEYCRESATAAERIACLEAALAVQENPVSQGAESSETLPPVPADPPPTPTDTIGAEQVRARNETSAEIAARLASVTGLKVAAYSEVPYQRLQVELENGQIWRQISGDTQHVRVDLQRNQTVDIEESQISGYRLRLNEMRRTIRVERIK